VPGIAVVADSTCDIVPDRLKQLGVTMVPLKVHFGDDTYKDWVDFTPEEFYAKLKASPVLPTTSQPTPGEFADVYRKLDADGYDGVVVVTLSQKLSGTFESATMAIEEAPLPVRVVDSMFVSGATGLIVEAACAARDAGGDIETVERAAHDAVACTELFFVLDTLDYLVKGGRAGRAQGLAAALLSIKPVLQVKDGVIEPFSRAKGSKKAISEMAAHVAGRGKELGPLRVRIIYALSLDLAQELEAALRNLGVKITTLDYDEIGSVIGTHVGPGAVGVCYLPDH
jgi:DegV family protein with EDD domain